MSVRLPFAQNKEQMAMAQKPRSKNGRDEDDGPRPLPAEGSVVSDYEQADFEQLDNEDVDAGNAAPAKSGTKPTNRNPAPPQTTRRK
jgi:hypothetical protein